jgi:hypothetical protein
VAQRCGCVVCARSALSCLVAVSHADCVLRSAPGGPGCSSFDGFVYEHGPFAFAPAPAGGAVLTRNAYAWSTVAHVVYLDSPAGVGLSYSDTPADYATNDTATAADADAFLRAFMLRYPRLADNELYIAGESYAGVYVPNLARAVARGNDAGAEPALNLVVRAAWKRAAVPLCADSPRTQRRGTWWATAARMRSLMATRWCRMRWARA